VLLLALAVVGAFAVFISVSRYVSNVRSRVGPMTTVLHLTRDIGAYQSVTAAAITEARVPRRWAPRAALHSPAEAIGRFAATDLASGSLLQRGVLLDRPVLQPGEREVAILLDAETGVAGKITSGTIVDIYATFAGGEGIKARSEIIVAGARVVDVGLPITTRKAEGPSGFAEGKAVPVTFALTLQDSLVLTYAESFGTKVRLGLVPPGDNPAFDKRSYQLTPP
jgi:pilus assembly protein CpaB